MNDDPKTNLLEHSQAKLELYKKYLSAYLEILYRADFCERIYIFDLFCGEGVYKDGSKGSPIIALETIKEHYERNKNCKPITLWFNDSEDSEIEKDVPKIDRVRRFITEQFQINHVSFEFFKEDYRNILPRATQQIKEKTMGLFFLDPYGYKHISINDLQSILQIRGTEIFLWLPIAHMYRFANSARHSESPGVKPLRSFLNELFNENIPTFTSQKNFVQQIKDQFRSKLQKIFVDAFTIERDQSNIYALFFFSRHIKGFEKMLEAKWIIDRYRGQGFSSQRDQQLLLDELEISGYRQNLWNFIQEQRTNEDIYKFGLEHGFLPKHTNDILRKWANEDKIEIVYPENLTRKGYFIQYKPKQTVYFRAK